VESLFRPLDERTTEPERQPTTTATRYICNPPTSKDNLKTEENGIVIKPPSREQCCGSESGSIRYSNGTFKLTGREI
jgi:hypothetical protein